MLKFNDEIDTVAGSTGASPSRWSEQPGIPGLHLRVRVSKVSMRLCAASWSRLRMNVLGSRTWNGILTLNWVVSQEQPGFLVISL